MSPLPEQNEADAVGVRTAAANAKRVLEAHKKGLQSRRQRDLISEKLILHIDGSGDFQWADIFEGQAVVIPRDVSEYRKTENVLRLIVENAVAHHTTMQLRYMAESMRDEEARDRAIVDTVWANYLAQTQDFNGLFAEAMYLAMPAGFCPVHGYWREDVTQDWYEPGAYGQGMDQGEGYGATPSPGIIDCFVGNPFATVFDVAARRGSCRWSSYERWLPAQLLRDQFGHMPGVDGIEGTTRIPSAAEFQMIARSWSHTGTGVHGSPVMQVRRDSDEEMLSVICRETAPGVDGHKDGLLEIIAVPGRMDARRGEGGGHAILLASQALPGRDFSWTNFYSSSRGSDIHGKPWPEDLDQLQVDLNIARSKRWEAINKMIEAPIITPGGAISEDVADLGGYQMIEVEPSLATWRPKVMEWPQGVIQALDNEVAELRRAMYTQGGYQAASRGEAPGSRMAYRAIVALQQADNSVHGPVNIRFQRSACDFMRRQHSQFVMYGSVPWLADLLGDEFAHLADPYIDNTKVSPEPPQYRLVNAFGPSPELRAQEVLELMQIRGSDGKPFLRTEEARRQYPNSLIFDAEGDPTNVQRRRAKTVSKAIRTLAKSFREETGFQETDRNHPWMQQAAQEVFQQAEGLFPRLRDDLLDAHIAALSEVTQNERADPIARIACQLRQDLYYQWQAMMAGIPMGGSPDASAPGGGQPGQGDMNGRAIAAEMQGGGETSSGTTLDDAEVPDDRNRVSGTAR